MNFIDYLKTNQERIWFLFVQHVELVLLSVGIATVISIGLAVATERTPFLRRATMSTSGTILTIPSFALFGLMIPIFGLGVFPTILALTLYAIFPIFRNAVTGFEQVDEGVLGAAEGMGMSTASRFWRVKFPLAWPVMLNGVRVATIMIVATAAIGAAVRGPGLGELIFSGLARIGGANALNEALAGVLGIVLVAALLDLFFVILGRLTTSKGLHV